MRHSLVPVTRQTATWSRVQLTHRCRSCSARRNDQTHVRGRIVDADFFTVPFRLVLNVVVRREIARPRLFLRTREKTTKE